DTRDNSPSVSVPAYSLDGKLAFDRQFELGGSSFYQTLEPRLFYVKIPHEHDQNTLPIFDTDESQPTSYSHFFRENRFTGGDRVGDTEQITLGMTSRMIDNNTGAQRMQFGIGQVYYLEDRHLRLNSDDGPLTIGRSGFFTELTANVNEDWSMTGFASWRKESSDPDVIWLSADYDHGRRRNASIAYTANHDDLEQVQVDFSAPLGPRWQLDADTAYSLEENDIRSSSVRLSFDGCCWATRLEYQYYLDGTGEFRNRILFTLELDDLGRIRSGFGTGA
ncbi:MAG: LPS assembly protein LptD, partial [Gammaproteobacteria bacterium]|nr:LPS assembly protein LptD [Gammaproteobacteria bacterium]